MCKKQKIKKLLQSLLVLKLVKKSQKTIEKQTSKQTKKQKRSDLAIHVDFVGVKQLHCRGFNFKYNFCSNKIVINQCRHLSLKKYSETLGISYFFPSVVQWKFEARKFLQ